MAGNAVIKHLSQEGIPPVETVFFRSLGSLVLLAPFAFLSPGVLRTRRLGLHGLRGVVQGASMVCFFSGIGAISLVDANALEFTAPLFATLFAILFFGEQVRWRRIAAMGAGFLGALIALRPGFAEVTQGHGFILVASILWASVLLMIRRMSTTESALTQSLYIGFVIAPLTGIAAAFVWVTPNLAQFGFLCTVAVTATLGQYLFAQAFRYAEMSAVLPLDFTKLIWSTIIGYFAFSYVPDVLTILGAAIIFAAGAYITIREARMMREAARAAEALEQKPQ